MFLGIFYKCTSRVPNYRPISSFALSGKLFAKPLSKVLDFHTIEIIIRFSFVHNIIIITFTFMKFVHVVIIMLIQRKELFVILRFSVPLVFDPFFPYTKFDLSVCPFVALEARFVMLKLSFC